MFGVNYWIGPEFKNVGAVGVTPLVVSTTYCSGLTTLNDVVTGNDIYCWF
jgi:hypothetical protein